MNKPKQKKLLSILFIAGLLMAILYWAANSKHRDDFAGESFKIDKMLRFTPVKDQGDSGFHWIYAMLATIESEHLMLNDSINLAPTYTARFFLQQKAKEHFLSRGEKAIDMKGTGVTAIRLLQYFGTVDENAFLLTKPVDWRQTMVGLTEASDSCLRQKTSVASFVERTENVLDKMIRPVPQYVFMAGREYTTAEFARSVCRRNEYVMLTSFAHHSFGKHSFLEMKHDLGLEIIDNISRNDIVNVPVDTLQARIDCAIVDGHPVYWSGHINEQEFSFKRGTARLANEKSEVNQKVRQVEFEQKRQTENHAMAIVGMAHDKNSRKYYICKNSWGTKNPYKGLVFMSENYLRARTLSIMMSQDALDGIAVSQRKTKG